MSSRRRAFAIDAPPAADLPPDAAHGHAPRRRGPMAAAVTETAGALTRRAAAEAAARAENDQLAAAHVAARDAGLVLRAVDPDAVEAGWLHRDRAPARDPEIDVLKASIAAVGLSNPIRLAELPGGRLGLVQGWRRLAAWRELRAETGDPAYAAIPAAVAPAEPGPDGLTQAYRRMVDENLARRDVSFAEMAALARAYADEADSDVDAAVDALFASAAPQKRSYIRAFADLLARAGHALAHPAAIPRALGLTVRKRLSAAPEAAPALWDALRAAPGRDAGTELAILRAWAEGRAPTEQAAGRPAPRAAPVAVAVRARLDDRAEAVVRGERVTLRLAAAPATLDPDRLRAALAAFLAALEHEG